MDRARITANIREYQKNYRASHRVRLAYISKKHYYRNKESILERLCAKNECPCGGRFTTVNKTQHEKTLKHTAHLNEQLNA